MLSGLEWRSYFWIASQGRLRSEDSRLRSEDALERLYLIAAIAILYATSQGMAVQVAQLRQQVDPHWRRGISYLKIGLRWLQGVLHKGRELLTPIPLLPQDPPDFSRKLLERSLEKDSSQRTGLAVQWLKLGVKGYK